MPTCSGSISDSSGLATSAYTYGQLRRKTASPLRKAACDSSSLYWSTDWGATPSEIMLCQVSRPAADSGLSMTTFVGSSGSRTLPPWVQMYSQPLHTPPAIRPLIMHQERGQALVAPLEQRKLRVLGL